jgi:hypothetical protein
MIERKPRPGRLVMDPAGKKRRFSAKLRPSTEAALRALAVLDKCTHDHLLTQALCLYAVQSQGFSWARKYFDAARVHGNDE